MVRTRQTPLGGVTPKLKRGQACSMPSERHASIDQDDIVKH